MAKSREGALFTVSNALSLLRILLTPLFLFLAFQKQGSYALLVFFIAAWTDWADGFVARRFHQESTLGRFLDPLADKILLVASYLGFYFLDFVPLWLVVIVVGRDVFMLAAAVALFILRSDFDVHVLFLSKINTCLQILHIVLVLVRAPSLLMFISALLVSTTTIASGFYYGRAYKTWYSSKRTGKMSYEKSG